MTQDPRNTARAAREGLAQGLNLLQTPGLPPQFLDAAEPIARAMGSLMQAERSDGAPYSVKPHADVALGALREALGRLQTLDTSHPAAEQAMGAVAGALGNVHQLSNLQAAPQVPTQYQPPQQAYQPPPQAPQFAPPPQAPQFAPPPQAPQFAPPPQAPQFAPPPQAPQFAPAPQAPAFQPPAHGYAAGGMQQTAVAPPIGPGNQGGIYSPSQHPPPAGPESLRAPAGTIEAELGAHSHSNFYKTLSGNDIVEHGGIFVATYNIPKLNQRVQLRVHLPGGYHFDATGMVRWTREARDNPDAPPGFGVQFQGITAEQRGLIQRYVRNREPLFYDDL